MDVSPSYPFSPGRHKSELPAFSPVAKTGRFSPSQSQWSGPVVQKWARDGVRRETTATESAEQYVGPGAGMAYTAFDQTDVTLPEALAPEDAAAVPAGDNLPFLFRRVRQGYNLINTGIDTGERREWTAQSLQLLQRRRRCSGRRNRPRCTHAPVPCHQTTGPLPPPRLSKQPPPHHQTTAPILPVLNLGLKNWEVWTDMGCRPEESPNEFPEPLPQRPPHPSHRHRFSRSGPCRRSETSTGRSRGLRGPGGEPTSS